MNKIITTSDGSHSIQSGQFEVSYHSIHGAIQESQHVFIEAALYHKMATQKDNIRILEIGFGTGLNALMTQLEADKNQVTIDYHTYEKYPISIEQAAALNYPAQLNTDTTSLQQLHTCPWETTIPLSEQFTFTKWQKDFVDIDTTDYFDIIYFDAFAPNAQAELWEAALLAKMYAALRQNGLLTTYCAKGAVKRCLKSVGFTIESIPGPPGKREMTRAIK